MSILVATDFSACSRAAVRLATALARRRGVSLHLVHAVEPPPVEVPQIPMGATDWETTLVTAAEVAIARDASEIRQSGMAVETRVLYGSAARIILDTARDQGAEMIVVGTHGRKGAAHLFLGSVAETVVRLSTCPVLVTRDAVPDLDRWEGRTSLRLAVATDGSSASQAALSWVGKFAKASSCDLSLVRIYWPPGEAMRYGLDDPWGGPRRDPELLPLLERDLRRDAEALIGKVPERIRFRAASSELPEVLAEEGAALSADAIVIGVPPRRAMRWTVVSPGAILRSSTVPVLCVPETPAASRRLVPQLRSVLVATDLSDASRAAVLPAYGLLRAGGGHVELCTVHAVGMTDAIAEMPIEPPLGEKERAEAQTQLRALIPPDAEAYGITTGVSVIEGRFAAEAILAAAERFDADVIAIGSHGRSGFKRALLGSVAEEVARNSPRPVLIARAQPAG